MKKYWLVALLAFFANTASAEQKIVKGDWDIHYIAFASSFIEPDVAKQYGLKRSKYQGIINISVLDNDDNDKAQRVSIKGYAKNLAGQKIKLNFKQVTEGEAIYYLAQIRYHDNQPMTFDIDVSRGDRVEKLKFKQKFYVE